MKVFREKLASFEPADRPRRWVYVAYDQLSDGIGPLRSEKPGDLGIVLVENPGKAARRPYHQQKLALILANQRHFALEQARRGVAVRVVVAESSTYAAALRPVVEELGPLVAQTPAERELRDDLKPLVDDGSLTWVPHEGWLTSEEDFRDSQKSGRPPWRMDSFYRQVRRRSGILMEDGKPIGGKFSFDAENREPWTGASGEPEAPTPPRFRDNAVKREVVELVETRYSDHPGRVDPESLPTTRRDAERLWKWARENCLRHFGPYEDAMSVQSRGIFHTRISALLNIHRLLPREILDGVLDLDLSLASQEGFVRQLIGWREFVRHVHEATDGFRSIPSRRPTRARDGGAAPSFLRSRRALPPAFWGEPSGLSCLDEVVRSVWEEGYSHHITRLMVLSNIATLLDVSPRELTDWFWSAYTDAFDWVVEPNVLAMGTFGVGELMTTKPYVSGAAYIDRMSDYCSSCAFDPRKDCPITSLYWAFLQRKRSSLEGNRRMALPLASAAKRDETLKKRDRKVFRTVSRRLGRGEPIQPDDLAD